MNHLWSRIDHSWFVGRRSCNLIYDHNGTMAEVRQYILISPNHYTHLNLQPYLLSHPKLLKPLQGISVPHLLRRRTSRNGNWVTYDLETYGSLRQRLLYGPLSEDEKQLIVDAYEDIHQRGILHGEVSFDNVLIGASFASLHFASHFS